MKNETFKIYQVYLANGELLGRLSFTREAIKSFWPGAKIVRNKVYLQ